MPGRDYAVLPSPDEHEEYEEEVSREQEDEDKEQAEFIGLLNFCYERCVENNNGICVLDEYIYVENVDAIAIQKAFGVENYKSIYNYIKEHFNGCNGVRNFVDFLNQNQIDYTIRK
jgi:hypothetical protein